MTYARTYTLVATPAGDTVKAAIATKLDGDLTNIFTYLNTHEALTATHGATGAVVGTTNSQVLTNKTLTAPVINGTVTTTGLTMPAFTAGGNIGGSGLWQAGAVAATYGGTGLDTSASTGVPKISAGTWSVQALTNGQLLIGSTGAVPSAATLTAGGGISITNAAGSITVAQSSTSLEFVIDGGGAVITAGVKGYFEIPFNCTLTAWKLIGNASGAIKIDVWVDSYATGSLPDNSDTICNGHEPEIAASAYGASDTDLSDWTDVTMTQGQTLALNVDSCTSITLCTLSFRVTRT